MEDFQKGCCPATTGAPPNFVAAMHRSRTARSALRGLFAKNSRFSQLEHHVIYHSTPPPNRPILHRPQLFSTEVVRFSLLTVNRCDSRAVAILRVRRTMSSTLQVLGSRGSSPMEDFEKHCCPATTGAPLHSVPAMHRSRTARSALRGRFAANPRVWRLGHQVISCSHS